jgi:hypothetical protein
MPDIRTPFQDSTPSSTISPQLASRSSEKILADIKRMRLRTLKRLFLALVLIVGGGVVSLQWLASFKTGTVTFSAAAATIALLAFMPIAAVLLKWYVLIAAQAAVVFLMVAPFWKMLPSSWLILMWVLGITIMTMGGLAVQSRAREMISFKLSILGGGVGMFIFGFSLLFTGIYYGTIATKKLAISEESIAKILTLSQGAISRMIPGFNPTMNMDEYIRAVVSGQEEKIVKELEKDPLYLALPESQRNRMRSEALERLRRETSERFSEMLKKPINPKQQLVSVISEYFNSRMAELSPQAQQGLLAAWVTLIFFTAWSTGMLLRPIIMIITWIFLEILFGIKLVEVAREPVERKYLTLT